MKRNTFIVLATLILFGGMLLRLIDLHRYPPGLHYDEAADMLLSRDVAFFGYNPFPVVTAYSGREALFYYLAAPLLRIFGTNVMATRLTSAFLGILAVAATIALGKAMLRNRLLALLAGGWLAVSGPEVWLSRQGFRTSPQPLLAALGLWLLWVALRRTHRWILPAILAGIFSGLTLYVYMAARIFPIWLLLPLAVLILVDRRGVRLQQAAVFFTALGITALPIGIFYANHLDVLTDRLSQLAPTSQTPTLLESLGLHLRMFFIQGDPILRYNLYPGRPFFDPLSGILLIVGLGLAAWKLFTAKQPLERTAAAFLLFCPLLIAPSVIAVQGYPPSHLRSVAMVPLIFFVPALAMFEITRRLLRRSMISRYALSIGLLVALGGLTWHDYQVWGARADLFYDSDGDLNLGAAWLEQVVTPNALMYISSKYYEDPTILAHNLDAGRIRWMMEDHLILPPPDREAFYVIPRSVKADPWLDWLKAGRVENIPAGPDGAPAFQAFHFAPGQLIGHTPSISLMANVGGILRLHGADLPTTTPDTPVIATLYWEVIQSPGRDDMAPVVSLVDAWNNEIERVNPYFEYSGRWLPGEWIIQRVTLRIRPGNPPGLYTLKVAWVGKTRQNDYFSLLDDGGRFAGIWTEIKPLRVAIGSAIQPPPSGTLEKVWPGIFVADVTPLPGTIRQGEHLRFTVHWWAEQQINGPDRLQLIVDRADGGDSRILWSGSPVHDTYPFAAWQPGQSVLDRYDVPIPPDFPPGDYRLMLTGANALHPAMSATLQVQAVAREFNPPQLGHNLDLSFGDMIGLIGYDIQPTADQKVTVKLVWRALAIPDQDYTVFVHILNPDNTIFSQQDSPPSRPTSQWIEREVITDSYTLAVPKGKYSVAVGLYVQDNGLRLAIHDAAHHNLGDSVTLTP